MLGKDLLQHQSVYVCVLQVYIVMGKKNWKVNRAVNAPSVVAKPLAGAMPYVTTSNKFSIL